jgi:hypothetical protein
MIVGVLAIRRALIEHAKDRLAERIMDMRPEK